MKKKESLKLSERLEKEADVAAAMEDQIASLRYGIQRRDALLQDAFDALKALGVMDPEDYPRSEDLPAGSFVLHRIDDLLHG